MAQSALSALDLAAPDLILLDVEMPVMDGLVTLRELRARGHRMPVIMCSSLTQRGAKVTIEALACGACDYVAKPAGQAGREAATRALAQELIPKIHALTSPPATAVAAAPRRRHASAAPHASRRRSRWPRVVPAKPLVLAIGVSTGGPAALDILLPRFLPAFRFRF